MMRIAYIATDTPPPEQAKTRKRQVKKSFHQIATEAMEERYAFDRLNAINKCAPEYERLNNLKKQLHSLKQKTK